MKAKFVLCLFLVAFTIAADVTEEEGVLVLTEANFDQVLTENKHVLVEFYAPWCGHCKQLAPEYAKAAQVLKKADPAVVLGKVDSTVEKKLAEKFQVQGYPTLKFYIEGKPIEYNGGRTESEIVSWCNKKVGPASKVVETVADLEAAVAANKVVVVYFGNTQHFSVYEQVARSVDDVVFLHTTSAEVAAKWEVKGETAVVLLKQFDEKRNDFSGEYTVEALKAFIDTNSVPTILEFDQKAAQVIFGEGKPCLFVFYKENDPQSQSYMDMLTEVSEKLKGKILMSFSQVEKDIGKRLGDFIGVTPAMVPTVRIVNPSPEKIIKYELPEDISTVSGANMVTFVERYAAGSLTPAFKSEPVPENNDGPVKVVVRKNWEAIVRDSTKDVLVEFYAPWCGHCQKLTPIYEEVGKAVANNPNIIIAKVDATANDIDNVDIKGFPTIKFFPSNAKDAPLDYDGERTQEGFMTYLKKHATVAWVEAEKKDL